MGPKTHANKIEVMARSARIPVFCRGLATVERILVDCGDDPELCWEEDALCSLLAARGYAIGPHEIGQSSVLFSRPRTSN